MYTKVCRNMVYIFYTNILYTFCIQKFVEIWDTFCIYTNILYIFYAKFIQKFDEMWDTFCTHTFCIHFV